VIVIISVTDCGYKAAFTLAYYQHVEFTSSCTRGMTLEFSTGSLVTHQQEFHGNFTYFQTKLECIHSSEL